MPLFPATPASDRELVEKHGSDRTGVWIDAPIVWRKRFCKPGTKCISCTGKKPRGHGPYAQTCWGHVGDAGKVLELEHARAREAVRRDERELARLQAKLNLQKRKGVEVTRRHAGGAGAATPTASERRA